MRKAVRAGIQWLDKNRPGWLAKIDTRRLDLGRCTDCVIGQVDGFYHYLPDALAGDGRDSLGASVVAVWWMVEHGFTSTDDADWSDLTWIWKQELAKKAAKEVSA